MSTETTPIVTANGVIEVPLMNVRSVGIGDLITKDAWVICHDIPEVVEVEGLLGLSFLENFKSTIDYKIGELIIEPFSWE